MGVSALQSLRSAYLRLRPSLHTLPLSMLVTLIGVTIAAWALTLYQAISMDVPVGVAMRGVWRPKAWQEWLWTACQVPIGLWKGLPSSWRFGP